MKIQSKRIIKMTALLSVLVFPHLLVGCNTMEGAGTDIKAAGQALERSAEHAKEGSRPCPCCTRYAR